MVCFQIFLEFEQILLKTLVWLHNFPFIFGEDTGFVVIHAILLHQEGDDKRGGSGHAHLTMYKDVVILEHRLDVCMGPIQMRIDVGILVILQINPLAMLDLSLLYLLLHSIVVVCPLINNAQNTVDLVLLQYFHFVKHIHSAKIKIALVLRRVLFIGVDVDYVAAQLLPVHTNKEFIYTFNHKLYHFYLCIAFLKVKLYLVFLYIPLSNFLLEIECFHLLRLSSVNISKLLLSNNRYLFCPFSFQNTIIVSEAKLKLTTIVSNKSLLSI